MEYTLDENRKLHANCKKIKFIINNTCWECTSHCKASNNGYMAVSRDGKGHAVHRYVYELFNDKIPEGMIIMHSCDNPKCINPAHLSVGTIKENAQDMAKKGRVNKNSAPKRKLNEEHLLEIKSMLLKGMTNNSIAENFPVSGYVIGQIKKGKSCYSEFLGGGINDWMDKKSI